MTLRTSIVITGDVEGAKKALRDLARETDRAEDATDDLSKAQRRADGDLRALSRSASGVISGLRGTAAALGIVSVAAAGRAYLHLADEAKQLTAQLKLATAEIGRFGDAQEDSRRIAVDTRNGLAETTKLYANFLRATKEIGGEQEDASRATETFAKTLKISGAGAAEAGAATLQFGQALASGVLRGDEFNSIMEASPRLARLLADSLGVPIGQLRAMAEEGDLTSDRLFRALTDPKFTEAIDTEFRQLPVTFDEAMQQVENAAIIAFGAFDEGGQYSTAIANFVTKGADGFADLAHEAEQFGITTRATLDTLGDAFDPVLEAGRYLFGELGNMSDDLAGHIRATFREIDAITGVVAERARNSALTSRLFPNAQGTNLTERFDDRVRRGEGEARDREIQRRFGFGPGGLEGFMEYGLAGRPPRASRPASRSSPSNSSGNRSSEDRDAAKAARELARDLEDLEKRYDPIAAAAREYREELEKIAALQKAHKQDPGKGVDKETADALRRAAALKRFDEEEKAQQQAAKAYGGIAEDFGDAMLIGMLTAGEAIDRDLGAAARRATEQLRIGGIEAADAIAGVFGYKFARIFAEVTADARPDSATGKLLSGFGKGRSEFIGKAGDQLEGVFKKVFGGNGEFAATLGKTLGEAYAGAQFGGAIGKGLTDVFGFKGSKLGSQLGGAIGGAIGGPLGSIIGGTLGSLAGGMLKKAKTGTATVGNVSGAAAVSGTRGNSDSRISAARGLASGALGALDQIIEALGGELGSFSGSIGIRDKKFVVDPTGKGRTKGSGVQKFKTEQEAQAALLADILSDGAVKGISAAIQKALKSSSDVDKALKEALKVQEVELALGGIGAAFDKAFRDFERQASERVRIAKAYGFDIVQLEALNAKERLKLSESLMQQQVGSLQRLVDEMTRGSMFEGSALDKREALLTEIGKAKADLDAGVEGAGDKLAGLFEQLNAVSKDAFGTTGGFAADRNAILDQARAAIARSNEKIAAAQAKVSDPALATTNAALDENNEQNARIIAALDANNQLMSKWLAAMGTGGGFGGLAELARTSNR